MSKRILVTGGAGFLASHLCERLIEAGAHVVCLDNFSTGSRDNVAHLQDNPRFELLRHDVCEPISVEAEEIYNLACPASPARYRADPVGTTRTSVLGALNMLDLARATGARVLQASTSEVYGDPAVHPQTEAYRGNVSTIGPRACYDEGKRCAETLFFDYHRQYGVAIKVARIFNTYGPRLRPDDGRVISNFIVQALAGKKLTVYGEGRQSRAFCYVDDMVEALVRLMDTEAAFTGPVNLGNPEEVTVAELAARIIDATGSRSEIIHEPLPEDDPTRRCPDISLAEGALGWRPEVTLDDGLARTIDYFRATGNA